MIKKLSIFIALALLGAVATGCSDTISGTTETDETTQQMRRPLLQDRFQITDSQYGVDETLSRLLQALDRRDLSVFAVIDHAAAADNADMELAPTTLVIFGNPRAGTPLIDAEPLLGAELPMRALVYERGGQTKLAMTGMRNLRRAYQLNNQSDLIDRLRETLDAIAQETTGTAN